MATKAKTTAKKTAKTKTSAKKAQAAQTDVFSVEQIKEGVEQIKDKFEQAVGSLGNVQEIGQEVTDFSKANVEAVVASATAAGKGINALGTETVNYTKSSLENGVQATKAAFTAKSLQEFVEIQSDFAKNAFDAHIAQINKMTDIFADATAEAAAPIGDRVNAVVEKVQGA